MLWKLKYYRYVNCVVRDDGTFGGSSSSDEGTESEKSLNLMIWLFYALFVDKLEFENCIVRGKIHTKLNKNLFNDVFETTLRVCFSKRIEIDRVVAIYSIKKNLPIEYLFWRRVASPLLIEIAIVFVRMTASIV